MVIGVSGRNPRKAFWRREWDPGSRQAWLQLISKVPKKNWPPALTFIICLVKWLLAGVALPYQPSTLIPSSISRGSERQPAHHPPGGSRGNFDFLRVAHSDADKRWLGFIRSSPEIREWNLHPAHTWIIPGEGVVIPFPARPLVDKDS